MATLGRERGEGWSGTGGRYGMVKVLKSYLQGEDGTSDKGGFFKEMKDPTHQQNLESLKERGRHLICTLGRTKMNQGLMSKRLV